MEWRLLPVSAGVRGRSGTVGVHDQLATAHTIARSTPDFRRFLLCFSAWPTQQTNEALQARTALLDERLLRGAADSAGG